MPIRSFKRPASRILVCSLLLVVLLMEGSFLRGSPSAHAASPLVLTSCPKRSALFQDITSVGAGGTILFEITSGKNCNIHFINGLKITQDLTLDASQSTKTVTFYGGDNTDEGESATTITVNRSVHFTLDKIYVEGGGGAFQNVGGILNNGGTVTLNNCWVAENLPAPGSNAGAGGIYNSDGGTMTINNSFIINNIVNTPMPIRSTRKKDRNSVGPARVVGSESVTGSAGGIYNDGGTVTINGSTVTGNLGTTAGDIMNAAGTVTVSSSEVAWGIPKDCLGTITNGGGNQPSDGSCGF